MKWWNSVRNAESHHLVHKVREELYSTCAERSSENLCSSSGWRRSGKKKDRMKLRKPSNGWFSQFHPPLNANVLFCRFFFWISPWVWFLRFFSSKYGEFCAFFPPKKHPLCTLCKGIFIFIFLGCHCVKFHQEKCTNWETYCHFLFFLSLGFSFQGLCNLSDLSIPMPKTASKMNDGKVYVQPNGIIWISQPTKQRLKK
jgi:hypothetical protein